jgi:hypothetical protein
MTATFSPTTVAPRTAERRRGFLPDLFARSAYLLTGFPLALVAFVLLVTGVSVAAGTLVIVVGFAVAALTLGIARGFARIERARVDAVVGERMPRPAYQPLRPGVLGAVLSAGADPRRWLDLLHGIVAFPIATATFGLVVGWWAGALGGVTYGLWEWALPRDDPDNTSLAELIGLGDSRTADILLVSGLGVAALATLPLVVAGCAAVQTGIARALLGGWED